MLNYFSCDILYKLIQNFICFIHYTSIVEFLLLFKSIDFCIFYNFEYLIKYNALYLEYLI